MIEMNLETWKIGSGIDQNNWFVTFFPIFPAIWAFFSFSRYGSVNGCPLVNNKEESQEKYNNWDCLPRKISPVWR